MYEIFGCKNYDKIQLQWKNVKCNYDDKIIVHIDQKQFYIFRSAYPVDKKAVVENAEEKEKGRWVITWTFNVTTTTTTTTYFTYFIHKVDYNYRH